MPVFPKNPNKKSKNWFQKIHLGHAVIINSLIDRKGESDAGIFTNSQTPPSPWTVDHGINYFSVPPKKTHTQRLLSWFLVHLKACRVMASFCVSEVFTYPPLKPTWLAGNPSRSIKIPLLIVSISIFKFPECNHTATTQTKTQKKHWNHAGF